MQQYQSSYGQHPPGHSVPSLHCLLASILASICFLAINRQSAAYSAQYPPSMQQYQSAIGQHPPGHSFPFSHCLLVPTLASACFFGYKWTVSSSCCTVKTVWTAIPINIWTASSWAFCSIFTLLAGTHLGKCLLFGYKCTVSSSCCTIKTIWTAVPINIW